MLCIRDTHTHTQTHTGIKKESNTQIRAQSKGFHCPFTPDQRVREHRIRPLEINEDVCGVCLFNADELPASTLGLPVSASESESESFLSPDTNTWLDRVFSCWPHWTQQQRLGSLSCIPLKHELAFFFAMINDSCAQGRCPSNSACCTHRLSWNFK